MAETPKMVSEREAVLRERKAYADGVRCLFAEPEIPAGAGGIANRVASRAKERYPLPRVTRPRVVTDPIVSVREYRIASGQMQTRHIAVQGNRWMCMEEPGNLFTDDAGPLCITAERVALWADLIARPNEEVEDDG